MDASTLAGADLRQRLCEAMTVTPPPTGSLAWGQWYGSLTRLILAFCTEHKLQAPLTVDATQGPNACARLLWRTPEHAQAFQVALGGGVPC